MTEFFDDLQIPIHPILLTSPKHFHISALTRSAKEQFLRDTDDYKGFNNEFIQFVRSCSKENMEQNITLTQACVEDLGNLDRVRKNDYRKVIPDQNLRLY